MAQGKDRIAMASVKDQDAPRRLLWRRLKEGCKPQQNKICSYTSTRCAPLGMRSSCGHSQGQAQNKSSLVTSIHLLTPPKLSGNVNGHAQLLCGVIAAANVRDCLPIDTHTHPPSQHTRNTHSMQRPLCTHTRVAQEPTLTLQ